MKKKAQEKAVKAQFSIKKPRKVLLLGSGALKIGEAGEFDYSGSQALKVMKEEGVSTILVNPNIATHQTSLDLADNIYFVPITVDAVTKIIEKEKPDGILLAFGGQTALNCGVELSKRGVLKKHNVTVYGTPVDIIDRTEDRDKFVKEMDKIGCDTPTSKAVTNVKDALKMAKKLGYPVLIRSGFTLGGQGSGVMYDKEQLAEGVEKALIFSPHVLVEECLLGWKEIEYEVVRDSQGNIITVCNMENFDPLGIHTGESVVVAPSQTLTSREYHLLREVSIKAISHLGIVGECNIQFALNPDKLEYRIIEVNARLSRSSALASKATGYPLAYIAAKLALGYPLSELKNSVTQETSAFFEPALDYVVVKIPKWDLAKFKNAEQTIGSSMKSVGEVMAIGRSFPESFQKAIRMLDIGFDGVPLDFPTTKYNIKTPTPERFLSIGSSLLRKMTVSKISRETKITPWFIEQIKLITDFYKENRNTKLEKIDREMMLSAKKLGFSDKTLAEMWGTDAGTIRKLRKKKKVTPFVKRIDTLAAEYPAKTNYLYLTYHGEEHDLDFAGQSRGTSKRGALQKKDGKNQVMVLGSGAYRIGSSVEFDWCAMQAVKTLKNQKKATIMINCNPETVSTDYDEVDKLYFEELTLERVLDIADLESPDGVIVNTGGQVANNLALGIAEAKLPVMGTDPKDIDRCEDRFKFAQVCDVLDIDQPAWKELTTIKDAERFSEEVGFPVLIRPSYVLSGSAMNIAINQKDLRQFLKEAANVSKDHPVVVSKFIEGAREIEIDAVAQDGKLKIYAVSEHVENAGVHSGDATVVLPPQKTFIETIRRIKKITKKLAKELNVTGPFNIQFLAKNNEIKIIECNMRASRSFPFVSKVTTYNFIEKAVLAMLGEDISGDYNTLDLDYVGIKAPQFSFQRITGADPILQVEMSSTGEVGCMGDSIEEAFLQSIMSTGFRMPEKNILVSIGPIEKKLGLVPQMRALHEIGYKLFATQGTAYLLSENDIPVETVYKISEEGEEPNLASMLRKGAFDMIINIPNEHHGAELSDGYFIRRNAIDFNIPLITNYQIVKLLVKSMEEYKDRELPYNNYQYYLDQHE